MLPVLLVNVCRTEALINGWSRKDLEVAETWNQCLNRHKSVFLGCENAGLVLIECQNGHLVILDLNSLIWM